MREVHNYNLNERFKYDQNVIRLIPGYGNIWKSNAISDKFQKQTGVLLHIYVDILYVSFVSPLHSQ